MLKMFKLMLLAAVLCLGLSAGAQDTDKDGFPDSIESLLGTDPTMASSTPTGSSTTPLPYPSSGSVNVTLYFNGASQDSLFLFAYVNVPAGFDFTGQKVALDVGGYTHVFTMQSTGDSDPSDLIGNAYFSPVTGVAEGNYSFQIIIDDALAAIFADEGLTNKDTTGAIVSTNVALYMLNNVYVSNLNGVYTATLNQTGSASFFPGFSGTFPEINVGDFSATPNPTSIGQPVMFKTAFKVSDKHASLSGYLDFGDGNSKSLSGDDLITLQKDGVSHVYSSNGVYNAILSISVGFGSENFETFVIVGDDSVVNSLNGLISTANLDTVGMLSLNINISKIADAVDASTSFEDFLSDGSNAPASREVLDGLIPSRSVTKPSITVATTTAVDAGAAPRGKVRKMVPVGGRNVGDSGALPAPMSDKIVLKKVSGKFVFTAGKPDQVSFQGTITLPAGFNPAKDGGNTLVFGMGNIVDRIQIDAKGKPVNKSTGDNSRLKKVSVKYPKLPGGVAAGGEIATVSITMGMTGMSNAGFDTEGITATVRSDETGRKSVPRFVQVSVLLSDVAYDALLPVSFKLSSKGDSGQISGRGAK